MGLDGPCPIPGGTKGRANRFVSCRVPLLSHRPDIAVATASACIRHSSAPTFLIIAAIGFAAFYTPSDTPETGGGATVFLNSGASSGITA